jgi:hypothetical protein
MSKTDAIAANDDVIPDFDDVTDFADIQSRFIKAARAIMFDYDLVLDHLDKKFMRVTALELYLHCKNWPDPNTDKHCEQLSSATWYIRRRGSNANTSRVDITAGSRCQNIHCGLLVRGIDGTDGSGKALRRILRGERHIPGRSWLPDEINILEQIHGSSVFSGSLRLIRREEPHPGAQLATPRIGLRYPEERWSKNLRLVVEQT